MQKIDVSIKFNSKKGVWEIHNAIDYSAEELSIIANAVTLAEKRNAKVRENFRKREIEKAQKPSIAERLTAMLFTTEE